MVIGGDRGLDDDAGIGCDSEDRSYRRVLVEFNSARR